MKKPLGLSAVLLAVGATLFALKGSAPAPLAQTPLEKELALARKDGIPTTAAEFRATIKVPAQKDNAAQFYRVLNRMRPSPRDISSFIWSLNWDPAPEALESARAKLKEHQNWLDLGDQITKRPAFWMDRKWEDGHAVLYPEYAQGRSLAQLLLLRGTLKAREGDVAGESSDARGALRIASHFESETTSISKKVSDSITQIVLHRVTEWAFRQRDNSTYPALLDEILRRWRRPDLRAEVRLDLYQGLLLMDQARTKEGREKIGLIEEDRSPLDDIFPELSGQSVEAGKTRFAKGFRQYWKALKPLNQEQATAATFEMMSGLMSVPTAVKVVENLNPDFDESDRIATLEGRRMVHAVFVKAARATYPKLLDTSKFISPIDGKPVRYFYDGTELKISAGTVDDREIQLILPPKRPS